MPTPEPIEPLPFLAPAGVALSRLKVYATKASDGHAGGAPHVHFACAQAYFVLAGSGVMQTLSTDGFREFPILPGQTVWFSPGMIHRLINPDGKLEVLVMSQNAGVIETGDIALTFPAENLKDPATYAPLSGMNDKGKLLTPSLEFATRRRDHAVTGFNELRSEFQFQGKAALDRFYHAAVKLTRPFVAEWYKRWNTGANAANSTANVQINNLRHGHVSHLAQSRLAVSGATETPSIPGVCGTLAPLTPEGAST